MSVLERRIPFDLNSIMPPPSCLVAYTTMAPATPASP
jgi:hypothetical protein